ncbi:MAG: ECF transporter S component [Ardenticatenaceae bacterium]|nr:ECF transporter S component [Anaerolineales bacterium]MCB8920814.1 ECF transporter S component [Ardenticatenaceae bacterium]MCB8989773.1 ECF transporter S component [Ardenticatenaceae bacterium]MCB9002768.1 ECF transporter S component [Ardenticatenaceae bacterium]
MSRYFSTFQLVLLALFAALVVVAKIALKLPLQLSGHSGIFWMALIVVAAGIVPKPGAASLVGLTSGILAAFLGLGDFGALNTFLSYTVIGIGTDLALLLLRDLENLTVAALVGAIGHFGKFLVKWGLGALTGAPVGFVALGLTKAMIGYIVFGAIGGVLGALTLRALRRAGFFVYLAEKR